MTAGHGGDSEHASYRHEEAEAIIRDLHSWFLQHGRGSIESLEVGIPQGPRLQHATE